LRERGFRVLLDTSQPHDREVAYWREDQDSPLGKIITMVTTREGKVAALIVQTRLEPKQLEVRMRTECRQTAAAGYFHCGSKRSKQAKLGVVRTCGSSLIVPGREPSAEAGCSIETGRAASREKSSGKSLPERHP